MSILNAGIFNKEEKPNEPRKNVDMKTSTGSKSKGQLPDIKVLIVLGDGTSGLTATKINSEEKKYTGFNYDLFKRFEEALKNKYNFIVSYTSEKEHNYDGFAEKVAKGEYDLCAGLFHFNAKRQKLINYTSPLLIDANAVVHLKNNKTIDEFVQILTEVVKYMFALVIIGVFAGILLYFVDPERKIHSKRLNNNNPLYLIRSIMTGISSMFGEMGYLAERSSLKIRGVILAIILFIVASTLTMFIQAKTTSIMLRKEKSVVDKNTISNKTLLGFKGYAPVEKIKRFGPRIEYVDDMTSKAMVNMYKYEPDKYDGWILSYLDAYPMISMDPKLTISISGFGNEPNGFIINKEKQELLNDLNMLILKWRADLTMQNACFSYFGDVEDVPACSLT